MGARKSIMAEKQKAEKKQKAIAILRDCPTSPRKMRLVADIIRGVEINKALGILRYSKKEASIRMEKLLKSAITNWEAKNEGQRLEETALCVKEVFVDCGRMLKRIQPAPQGRAHRIRKRSNHVTIVVDRVPVKAEGANGNLSTASKVDRVPVKAEGARGNSKAEDKKVTVENKEA